MRLFLYKKYLFISYVLTHYSFTSNDKSHSPSLYHSLISAAWRATPAGEGRSGVCPAVCTPAGCCWATGRGSRPPWPDGVWACSRSGTPGPGTSSYSRYRSRDRPPTGTAGYLRGTWGRAGAVTMRPSILSLWDHGYNRQVPKGEKAEQHWAGSNRGL